MENYLVIAEAFPVWLCVVPAVVLVLFQAAIFVKKAYRAGAEIGMTQKQLNSAIRASAISSIGPALAILSTLLALLVLVGGPVAWMRLSYIGNMLFEALAFNFGITASGIETAAGQAVTGQAFVNGVWVMILGSIGWIIVSILITDKMNVVQHKISGGNPRVMQIIASCAMIAGLGSLIVPYVVPIFTAAKVDRNGVSAIGGAAVMAAICAFNKKRKIGWLGEWSLAFAILGGLVLALCIKK
ncbi:MAG: DUF5058 family protein [Synergistaceae bacterium]|jgi:hypothetical protein|nr:DUF5058 family protein [Synergistaceae bacterium]